MCKYQVYHKMYIYTWIDSTFNIIVTTGHNGNYLDNTELIVLNGNCSATLPNYPRNLRGATGVFINESLMICGGEYPSSLFGTNECFKLSKDGIKFDPISPMNEKRWFASSVVTHDGKMWVTGGNGGTNNDLLASTEIIDPQDSNITSIGSDLPEPIYGHVIIALNSTTSFLIGGRTTDVLNSNKTHYFHHEVNMWTTGPYLLNGRSWHAAAMIKDDVTLAEHIVVVGGARNEYENGTEVEIMFNSENQWTQGTQ